MFRSRKFLMLFSLFIAFAIWTFVMGEVDPQSTITVAEIKVEMRGADTLKDQGLEATLQKPKMVSATIRGKRSEVNQAKKKGLKAYIDVSTCDYGENEGEIRIDIPDGVNGVTVEQISQYSGTFFVE